MPDLPAKHTFTRLAVLLSTLASAHSALAVVAASPITLVDNTVNMFRDTRGANDVRVTAGDQFQFGADIVGGSAGLTLGATYSPSSFTVGQSACNPLAVNGNFCSRSTAFNAARLDPWTLRFKRGADTLTVVGPSLVGAEQAVPFPVSVTLSGSGLTPTISWQVPGAFAPDGLRVNVFDKNKLASNNLPDVVHSVVIAANATSYTLPATFSSGLALSAGGNYTINLQLIETRGRAAFTNNNALILRRSSSFFAFTPLTGENPPDVKLPTVVDGVYNFHVAGVGPSSVTFIDPLVAVGYDYATGLGDPNFASVLLPNVGDGQYTVAYADATGAHTISAMHDTQYFFPEGGVASFRVAGIETTAGLDPANATAFITGLTFAKAGDFTGTMTPITEFVAGVPEPQTYALMLVGLVALGVARRQRLR